MQSQTGKVAGNTVADAVVNAVGSTKTETPAAVPEIFKRDLLKELDYEGKAFRFYAPAGITVDHLTNNPALWAAMHDLLHPYDVVQAIARDNSWCAFVLILACHVHGVQTFLLASWKLPRFEVDISDRMPPGYNIREDPETGWVVTRLKDGVIMGTEQDNGFHTREEATRYLLDHASLRSM